MSHQKQPLQKGHPHSFPFRRRKNQQGHSRVVQRSVRNVAIFQPSLFGHFQKGRQILLFPGHGSSGVEHVQGHVDEIRDQVHVALGATTPGFAGEALILSESQKQQFQIMDG